MLHKSASLTPWDLTRMAPYSATIYVGEVATVIDPASQLGYLAGPDGQAVEARHRKTCTGTETKTRTNPGDGGPSNPTDEDQSQDSDEDVEGS